MNLSMKRGQSSSTLFSFVAFSIWFFKSIIFRFTSNIHLLLGLLTPIVLQRNRCAEVDAGFRLQIRDGSAPYHQNHPEYGCRRSGGRQEDHGTCCRRHDEDRRSKACRNQVSSVTWFMVRGLK